MNTLHKLNGWRRLWLFLAVLWLLPVTVFTLSELPRESELDIKAAWANEIVNLQWNHHGQGESLTAYRSRIYGSRTDEDIIHLWKNDLPKKGDTFDPDAYLRSKGMSQQEIDALSSKSPPRNGNEQGHFDPSTAVPVDEIEKVNQRYETALKERERQSFFKVLLIGVLVWVVPLVALYVFGIGVRWVYLGFKRGPEQ